MTRGERERAERLQLLLEVADGLREVAVVYTPAEGWHLEVLDVDEVLARSA